MANDSLELFAPGCLGTCWYGKYHYVEPWAGCSHACHYCYARFRTVVTRKAAELGTTLDRPRPLFPREALLERLACGVRDHKVEIVKLCRFTDIFSSPFVENGLAWDVLDALLRSGARRLIITTKGLPDERIIGLIQGSPERFSYNVAARPATGLALEPGLPPLAARLGAAAKLAKGGVQTTVHIDPMVPGFDDAPGALRPFFEGLVRLGLKRVMFSYLLLNPAIKAHLETVLAPKDMARLLAAYDLGRAERMLPGQDETDSFTVRPDVRRSSVLAAADQLQSLGLEYVLCSLKSVIGDDHEQLKGVPLCDGTFYA